MASEPQRPWSAQEITCFWRLLEERRRVGEIGFLLQRTEEEVEALAERLAVRLPELYDTSFLAESRAYSVTARAKSLRRELQARKT